jgi:uncharacterized membrane protein YvbJ
MPYCKKCGTEIKEGMAFCPECGTPVKVTEARTADYYKNEKDEKGEKNEKQEKMEKGEHPEKYETRPYGFLGPLVGGVILILIGFMFYLTVTGTVTIHSFFPFFLIVVGVLIIFGVLAGTAMARKRNPEQ